MAEIVRKVVTVNVEWLKPDVSEDDTAFLLELVEHSLDRGLERIADLISELMKDAVVTIETQSEV